MLYKLENKDAKHDEHDNEKRDGIESDMVIETGHRPQYLLRQGFIFVVIGHDHGVENQVDPQHGQQKTDSRKQDQCQHIVTASWKDLMDCVTGCTAFPSTFNHAHIIPVRQNPAGTFAEQPLASPMRP